MIMIGTCMNYIAQSEHEGILLSSFFCLNIFDRLSRHESLSSFVQNASSWWVVLIRQSFIYRNELLTIVPVYLLAFLRLD